jgi:hypothetical protein
MAYAVDTGMLLMKKKQNLLLGKSISHRLLYILECRMQVFLIVDTSLNAKWNYRIYWDILGVGGH